MTGTIDYANPPQWLRDLFATLYGDDPGGSGPSVFHLMGAAFFLAASLDARNDGQSHSDDVREIMKASFKVADDPAGEVGLMIAEAEKIPSRFMPAAVEDDNVHEIRTLLQLLVADIRQVGEIM